MVCDSAAYDFDNDAEPPPSCLKDTVIHAGLGISDSGTIGCDTSSDLGVDVEESTVSGPGGLIPWSVVFLGIVVILVDSAGCWTVILHLGASVDHRECIGS